MSRRPKSVAALSGEAILSGPAVFEPLPPADGTEKTCRPLAESILSPADAVRWQAGMLRQAIEAARSEGYVVDVPFSLSMLDRIVISATAKADT